MNAKDQFQLISFENNTAAFFADLDLLVNGFDHIAPDDAAKTLAVGAPMPP